MKRIKFETEADAVEMMNYAKADGHISAWTLTKSGYVRYLAAGTKYWFDLTEGSFRAWKYAY